MLKTFVRLMVLVLAAATVTGQSATMPVFQVDSDLAETSQ